jgi:hypothetical protein
MDIKLITEPTNLYYLTSTDYVNLTKVSFISQAPTKEVQTALAELGVLTTLTALLAHLNGLGYKSFSKTI